MWQRGKLTVRQEGEGLGDEGELETVLRSIHPSDVHPPSSSHHPEVLKPPGTVPPAADQVQTISL